MQRFYPIQLEENHKFLKRLLETPEELVSHIRRYATASIEMQHRIDSGYRMISAVVLEITYGYTVEGDDDSIVRMVDNVMEEFSASIAPGAFLVDLIPICKHFSPTLLWLKRKSSEVCTQLDARCRIPTQS